MAPILSVPPEVITHILNHLDPFEIEIVARTFNSHLYYPAVHLISSRLAWIKNARAMSALFPSFENPLMMPSYPGNIPALGTFQVGCDEIPHERYEDFGLDTSGGPYHRSLPPDLQSWMKLDGTFDWLKPLDEKTADGLVRHNGLKAGQPAAPKRQVDKLVAQAAKFGLSLPIGFETFLRSDRFHLRLSSKLPWRLQLAHLVKCPPSLDDGKGGYLLCFYHDSRYCAFDYLYMNPSGHHCVLFSEFNLYEAMGKELSDMEDGDEDDDGESVAETAKEAVKIVGLTFEEYLANIYFEELIDFKAAPFKGLCDYVHNSYLSPVKVEHLQKSCPDINIFLRAVGWKGKAK